MKKRVLAAVAVVVVLGGGSVAFVIWRSAHEKSEQVRALLGEVRDELASPTSTTEDRRGLLKRLVALQEENKDVALVMAEGEVLVSLGRAQEGWKTVEPSVTAAGASAEAVAIGARVAAATYAATGDATLGRQALALATESERGAGGAAAGFLAWQLAFRVGDVDAWSRRSLDVVQAGAGEGDARVIVECGRVLAELLASRTGFDTSLPDHGGLRGPLAEVIDKAPKATAHQLEQLALSRGGTCPELEIAIAMATLDGLGQVGAAVSDANETERSLRSALDRVESAVRAVPSSLEARHIAVIALAGLRQVSGLSAEDTTRLRAYLRWLLENGPTAHGARPVWEAIQRSLG
ncbi:MAG: hypothetical protein U1F36_06570 [Planctomycetota bacterium]